MLTAGQKAGDNLKSLQTLDGYIFPLVFSPCCPSLSLSLLCHGASQTPRVQILVRDTHDVETRPSIRVNPIMRIPRASPTPFAVILTDFPAGTPLSRRKWNHNTPTPTGSSSRQEKEDKEPT